MKTELLAPAKNKETAMDAINCGADAVYIGASSFGARKNASNSIEDIAEVVNYAHKYWVKVFVTLNTILTDIELEEAADLAKLLDKTGADGLIIQDLGLLNRLISLQLKIPIHMSTQCDNYLPQKVKFFNDIGVSRVVLARESSIEQIAQIHKENPKLELENFVHGALCVSFSGQCYLSQFIGGRSANRGECAQPCRKKYTVKTSDGKILKKDFYALCLKDFNASSKINELVHAGVHSFKIEGRLKDSNYVKNIVAYYRNILKDKTSSGKSFICFEPNVEKSFNRGFTEYFLNKREDCFNLESPKSRGEYLGTVIDVKKNCFKIKTKKDIYPQDGIYCKGEGFLVNKIDNDYIYPNRMIKLQKGNELYRNVDVEFEKLLSKPIKRQIGVNIQINDKYVLANDENDIEIKKELPILEIANNQEKMRETFIKQFSKTGESDFYILDIKIDKNIQLPFIQISEINQLRRDIFNELMKKRIETYNTKLKKYQKPLKYVQYFMDEVDYRANVHNKEAENFYNKCGCKVKEYSLETKIPNRQIELMRCKHCIKYALDLCKSPENIVLEDEKGVTYPLKFNCKDCEMSILNP